MTVESTTSRVQYAGNDAATEFAVPWQFLADDHVSAVLTSAGADTALALGVDYALAGAGDAEGGALTYPLAGDPLAAGQTLTIHAAVPLTQEKAWSNTDAIDVTEIEKADDKLTRICQQLSEELGRCLKFPVTASAPNPDMGALTSARDEAVASAAAAAGSASDAEDARDEAQAAAAGVNMPAIGDGDGDKALFAKGDESGLEYKAPADARAALGLGTAALADTGASSGNVPLLDAAGRLDASIARDRVTALAYAAAVTPDLTAAEAFSLALTGNADLGDMTHPGHPFCIPIVVTGGSSGSELYLSTHANWAIDADGAASDPGAGARVFWAYSLDDTSKRLFIKPLEDA